MSDVQNGAEIAQDTKEVKEVKQVKVSEVKELLNQGLDRKQIAAHFGKSVAEMAREVWSNPKLKNLKKKGAPTIVLVDDEEDESVTEEVAADVQEEVQEEAAAPAPAPAENVWGQ